MRTCTRKSPHLLVSWRSASIRLQKQADPDQLRYLPRFCSGSESAEPDFSTGWAAAAAASTVSALRTLLGLPTPRRSCATATARASIDAALRASCCCCCFTASSALSLTKKRCMTSMRSELHAKAVWPFFWRCVHCITMSVLVCTFLFVKPVLGIMVADAENSHCTPWFHSAQGRKLNFLPSLFLHFLGHFSFFFFLLLARSASEN